MSWRLAQVEDLPRIDTFLSQHIQTSMFPLANLRDYGLRGTDPRAVNIWMLDKDPRAILAMTNEGMVLPQCPDCPDQELVDAIDLIRGRKLFGVAGEATQTRRIMRLAGWENRQATLNSDEPSFTLDLDRLILPDATDAELVPLGDLDREVTEKWRRDYLIEVMEFPADRARKHAARDYESYAKRDSHRVLIVRGRPVAMTGFNVRLPQVVQIGGVYTPPDLRGRGYARLAVALHLQEARRGGATRAVLFAASEAAVRAYKAIGFQPAGHFSLILFNNPEDMV
ncbi:GNAT family N-acetyltransferase [Ruegeria sp.]|uniref:GNAT family N-acetyltransferase n=1 Tax=Ruegeria sp. TaxID=1879320 RepID=UPI003C7DCBC1